MLEITGYAAMLLLGIVLGTIGAGGSILTVPILVYLFSVQPVQATGYSLAIVGATALIGAAEYLSDVGRRTCRWPWCSGPRPLPAST
jgi:uncharacterized protein